MFLLHQEEAQAALDKFCSLLPQVGAEVSLHVTTKVKEFVCCSKELALPSPSLLPVVQGTCGPVLPFDLEASATRDCESSPVIRI